MQNYAWCTFKGNGILRGHILKVKKSKPPPAVVRKGIPTERPAPLPTREAVAAAEKAKHEAAEAKTAAEAAAAKPAAANAAAAAGITQFDEYFLQMEGRRHG